MESVAGEFDTLPHDPCVAALKQDGDGVEHELPSSKGGGELCGEERAALGDRLDDAFGCISKGTSGLQDERHKIRSLSLGEVCVFLTLVMFLTFGASKRSLGCGDVGRGAGVDDRDID